LSLFKSLKSEKNPTNMSWLKKRLAKAITIFKADKESGPKAYASSLPGFYGRYGEPKEVDQKKLLELAESDPDVRACIDAIVDAVTTNGWIIESESEQIKNRVEQYIDKNWGEDDFWMFLRNLTGVLIIFDEAYLEVTGDFPRIIAPWTMKVKRDQYGKITGYVQQTAYKVEFEPEEVVHIVLHPLADRAYGSPKLVTLRRILEAKREAELFYYTVFMRKGVLSKAIILREYDDKTFRMVEDQLRQTKPGDDLLLGGEIQIVDLGNPVRELQILDMLRDFRQKVLAVFRVPPIVYGLEGGVNLETSRNQMVNFQQHIRSIQRIIGAGVTEAIKRILKLDGFKIKLLEWTNPEQQTRLHVMKVQAGIETLNEAREALGLDRLETPIADMPLNLLQLGARSSEYFAWEIQDTLAQLMAQSARAFPEKSLMKAEKDRDRHDTEIQRLEKPFFRDLKKIFERSIRAGDIVSAKKQYGGDVRRLIQGYVYRAGLEGVEYVSKVLSILPNLSVVKQKLDEIIDVMVEDFFQIVNDKLSGLVKPQKPIRDYFEVGKQEEISEEELYPWQRLDYDRRLNLLGLFGLWAGFNTAIANSSLEAIRDGVDFGLMWIAKLDERTCPLCLKLHRKYWTPEEVRSGLYKRPPAHPNCRCRLVIVRGGELLWGS